MNPRRAHACPPSASAPLRIAAIAVATATVLALSGAASAQQPDQPEDSGATVATEAELAGQAPAAGPEGEPTGYRPVAHFDFAGITLEVPLSVRHRIEHLSSFPVDRQAVEYAPDPSFDVQARVGVLLTTNLALDPVRLTAEYEHDLLTGVWAGGVEEAPGFGLFAPATEDVDTELRKANLTVDIGRYVHVMGGFDTSQWGLGLLANDGAQVWEPGSAEFIDPRSGDRVLRGLLAGGPFTDAGLLVAFAVDDVVEDDAMLEGDEAQQVIASATLGYGRARNIGAYVVVRRQEAADGATLDVNVIDLAGAYHIDLDGDQQLRLSAEGALIWGETSLGPSTDFPVHDVLQLGAAARLEWVRASFGAVLDVLYASGDNNLDDQRQTGFKVDRNYPTGLLLYRYVLAAQTARAPVTAADPDLVGYPAEDLDRLPTQSSATNTIAFFPRGWWRPIGGLELYGGPLLALTEVDLTDPFNSRIAGGDPRNALNGDPGRYLGTEIDLGLRYRGLLARTELTAGLEGGLLLPGAAFEDSAGQRPDPVAGGRLMVDYRF